MVPQLIPLESPRPRNSSDAAAIITYNVVLTKLAATIEISLGKISKKMMRSVVSPLAPAAETNSRLRNESVCERNTPSLCTSLAYTRIKNDIDYINQEIRGQHDQRNQEKNTLYQRIISSLYSTQQDKTYTRIREHDLRQQLATDNEARRNCKSCDVTEGHRAHPVVVVRGIFGDESGIQVWCEETTPVDLFRQELFLHNRVILDRRILQLVNLDLAGSPEVRILLIHHELLRETLQLKGTGTDRETAAATAGRSRRYCIRNGQAHMRESVPTPQQRGNAVV